MTRFQCLADEADDYWQWRTFAQEITAVVLAAENVINNCPAAYGAPDDRRCVTEHEARLQTALNALAEKLEGK